MTIFDTTAPLLLDGAMGTMIQRHNLTEEDFRGDICADICADPTLQLRGNNDLLNLTRPDVIESIHREYLDACADIISTNTFSSQRISQADYRTESLARQINLEGARIARRVADEYTAKTGRPRYVAGSVGPTIRLLSVPSDAEHPERRDMSFDELAEAYVEQMSALIEGGVDALLIETALDAINAKAAIYAAEKAMETTGRRVALMLSITVSDSQGRVLSGQSVESYATSVSHANLFSIGLNCSMGAAAMATPLRRLASMANCRVSVHPNAGLPDHLGNYNDTPEYMAEILGEFVKEGLADIIGGCCGTTPDHISAFRKTLDSLTAEIPDRRKDKKNHDLRVSGMENLSLRPGEFMNIGERCNVAGSRKFLRLINEGKLDEAVGIARKQVEDGAMAIDINMDDGLLDSGRRMEEFANLLAADPVASKVPLMIDSSDFEVILRGVKCCQGKPIVNSISLKEGEEEFLRRARELRLLGAAVIVMDFDEKGQAVTFERKIEICERSYRLLTEEAGFNPADIIFDPNILTVATGMPEDADHALNFIKAAEWIHRNLPGSRVSGGLSNLSFAFRGNNYLRECIHAVFLHRALKSGMDMAIMNAATSLSYADIPSEIATAIEDVLFDKRDAESTERLSEIGMRILQEAEERKKNGTAVAINTKMSQSLSLNDRLIDALVKGNPSMLDDPLGEAVKEMAPLEIIAGPLMEGMTRTGKLFAEGKIFLPQVVKTARAMKYAVDFLQPYIEASLTADKPDAKVNYAGTALLATVKGDVHDIGKNIVGMILACNNFRVVDLGVMVPPAEIIAAAKSENPDFICLSGLITPSLREMVFTVEALKREGIDIPVMVGGAATSELHTALKIAPAYDGAVFHAKDASQNPLIGAQLVDRQRRDKCIAELKVRQENLRRKQVEKESENKVTDKVAFDTSSPAPEVPTDLPEVFHIPVAELTGLIDWLYFFHAWKVKEDSDEGKRLKDDAVGLLDRICNANLSVDAILRFKDAKPGDDSIIIEDETFAAVRRKGVSLADFLRADGEPIGLFATTTGAGLRKMAEETTDDYDRLLLHTLCDRLVEAAAEWLQRQCGWNTIRPAIGYPSFPDQTNIFRLDRLIRLGKIGIVLTETGAMNPPSSVAGIIMPRGHYF